MLNEFSVREEGKLPPFPKCSSIRLHWKVRLWFIGPVTRSWLRQLCVACVCEVSLQAPWWWQLMGTQENLPALSWFTASWVVKRTKWKGSHDLKQQFSPNVVPRSLARVASCHWLEMLTTRPIPDLMNQKLDRWSWPLSCPHFLQWWGSWSWRVKGLRKWCLGDQMTWFPIPAFTRGPVFLPTKWNNNFHHVNLNEGSSDCERTHC